MFKAELQEIMVFTLLMYWIFCRFLVCWQFILVINFNQLCIQSLTSDGRNGGVVVMDRNCLFNQGGRIGRCIWVFRIVILFVDCIRIRYKGPFVAEDGHEGKGWLFPWHIKWFLGYARNLLEVTVISFYWGYNNSHFTFCCNIAICLSVGSSLLV